MFPQPPLVYSLKLTTVIEALTSSTLSLIFLITRPVNCFSLICLFGQVFLEPLKEIQQMGHLQHVDGNKIFCNLEELCEVMEGKLLTTSSENNAPILSNSVLLNKT